MTSPVEVRNIVASLLLQATHVLEDSLPAYADIMERAAATLESLLAEREWQPIETAPRDGTVLLLLVRKLHAARLYPVVVARYLEDEWRGPALKMAPDYAVEYFSHWLPAPPAREGEGG